MSGAQKTHAYLEVRYPGEPDYLIDEIKEFSYSSSVVTVGDTCTFTVVNSDDGTTVDKLRCGARVRLKMSSPQVNGGNWTVKHSGRLGPRHVRLLAGTLDVTVPDLGWHLQHSCGALYQPLRGVSLGQLFDPNFAGAHPLIDPSWGFAGVHTSNDLTAAAKLGRASFAPPVSILQPMPLIQVNGGETIWPILQRYAARENCLINVGVDDYLQVWNPNYDREPLYQFVSNGKISNITDAERFDDPATRYSEVTMAGEILPSLIRQDSTEPNVTKRRGTYRAALNPKTGLPWTGPYLHRLTGEDTEMLNKEMAKGQAEWKWKQGIYQSHYLQVTVPDHYQGANWYECDQLAWVDIPALRARGTCYVESVRCDSTEKDGDVTTLILRLPHLLSAAYGVWNTHPTFSSPEVNEMLEPGTGEGS